MTGPLAQRPFRVLWLGQTASSFGSALVAVAFVFAILKTGGSAVDIGAIAAVQMIVKTALVLIGGVWADRMRRQHVMLAADGVRAIVQASLAILLITGHAKVWQLGLGACIFGAADAFFGPASTGLIPETVPAEQIQAANSWMSISASSVCVAGPAVAGILVSLFGPGWVFVTDGASFAVSAASLALLRLPARQLPSPSPFLQDLATGWREVKARGWYLINLIAHAFYNLAIPATIVLGPVVAADKLGGSAAWGQISASFACGAALGGAFGLRARLGRPLVAANLAGVLSALPMLALAVPTPTWTIDIASLLSGSGMMFLNTVWAGTMQVLIPDSVRSRVDSYDWLISMMAMPAGLAAVGPVAAAIGNSITLAIAAVLLVIPSMAIVMVPSIRGVRRTPDGHVLSTARAAAPSDNASAPAETAHL
jgi:MFS family permease